MRPADALALAAALLAALASATALVAPDVYARDPEALRPQLLGQDAITLLVGVPLVLLGLRRRGSLLGHVALAGGLLYLAYAYATYAFGVRFNPLFLAYVAILGAATVGFVLALRDLLARPLPERAWSRLPRRGLAAFLAVTALAFAAMWLGDILASTLAGTPPRAVADTQTPTSPVHVLDLAFVLPLLVLAAARTWRRDAGGALLAGVLLVKAGTISLAVLGMGAFAAAAGRAVDVPVATAMAAVLALALLLGRRYAKALAVPASQGADPSGGARFSRVRITPVNGPAPSRSPAAKGASRK